MSSLDLDALARRQPELRRRLAAANKAALRWSKSGSTPEHLEAYSKAHHDVLSRIEKIRQAVESGHGNEDDATDGVEEGTIQ